MSQLYAVAASESSRTIPSCDCLAHLYGNAADCPDRVRRYASDMTDAEWAVVRESLPVPAWMEGRGGQPEGYCHRQMIDAIRYLVDNGIKWRAMPVDFPAWDRVYAFYQRWRDHGLIKEFHDRLRGKVRQSQGRRAEPTAAIIDSQSVKAAASVPATSRGYDGGKNINGRKRHIIVDCLGLLLMVLVTPAYTTDRDMLPPLRARYRTIRLVWADGGYTGPLIEWAAQKLRIAVTVIKRSDDTHGFTVLPRRWVVEGTFGWLMRSRRLVRDYETLPTSSEAIALWSMTMVMSRRLARRRTLSPPLPQLAAAA